MARRDLLKTIGAASLVASAKSLWAGDSPRVAFSVRRLTLKHTWTIARNSSDYKDNVFVRIERDGAVGWGEAAPNVRYGESAEKTLAVLERTRPLLESADWFEYVDLRRRWETFTKDQTCAGAALDMAVLDWVGGKLGVPLWRLFGLDGSKAPITTFSIGIDTPNVVRQKVREAADFPVLKIKVGRDNDAEILAAVRDVTDCPLRVDANEGWRDKHLALDRILWLQDLGVELIEQPMPAAMLDETAWLRDRVDIPIIADEAVKDAADIPKLAQAYDGINIKLMKSGGIQEAMRMIHVARALDMKIMLGCMIASSVSITAAAHLSPLIDYADLDGNLLIADDPFTGVTVERGRLVLPDRPGLGVAERKR
ncbi:dipeptide epimerase [Anaerobaca lacustris]|uniref:Dipeptide epimerase n=1 Tax=Anaerobaca lacustris TaxID=3044600 RepID=A0AAW6TYA1_9BACT|nr:dipeptide epimerase [Sedimentisphaerales bacterium M17dextr]